MKARHTAAAALTLAGGSLAVLVGTRRWHQHWGATDEEIARPLPGDQLIADSRLDSTWAAASSSACANKPKPPPPPLELVLAPWVPRLGGRAAQTWLAVADRATSSHLMGGMTMGDNPLTPPRRRGMRCAPLKA
jgi:hypothetical protein